MSADIRSVLAGELNQLATDLKSRSDGLALGSEDAASECLGLCERLGQVAAMIEAPALQEVALFLMSNVPALMGSTTGTKAPAALCQGLEQCLLHGTESTLWSDFAADLSGSHWPTSLEVEAADAIIRGLKPLATSSSAEQTAPARLPALEDLTLIIADDVSADTLRAFHFEVPQQVSELSNVFAGFRQAVSRDALFAAQRLAHTIKGSSALVGLQAIVHLAHAIESVLQRAADSLDALTPNACELLLQASDAIALLIDATAGNGQVPEDLLTLIVLLHEPTAYGATTPRPVLPTIQAFNDPSFTPASELSTEVGALMAVDEPTVPASNLSPTSIGGRSQETGPALSVSVALIDDNLRRTGEINIAIGQLIAQVSNSVARADRLSQQLSRVQAQVYELETLVDARVTPAMRLADQNAHTDFDPLELDEYTALHSLSRAFSESTLDSRELSRDLWDDLLKLQNLLTQHARLGKELNESVTDTRLVTVASIVPRLERIVRQISRQLHREVDLSIRGRELSIDTDILNGLLEPLMHALRNAVDHGIEPSEERVRLGKPAHGRIELTFAREGNRIEVICRDDGRGIDLTAVEQRGRERGLLQSGTSTTEPDLLHLVFSPGFSTRDEISAISGRGIGMDAIKMSVEKLKGSVRLQSDHGKGCILTLRLPLSLTSAHVLFVAAGDCTYGLPSTAIEQVLFSDAGRVIMLGDQLAFAYGDAVYPLHSLETLLGLDSQLLQTLATNARPLVLAHAETGMVAIAVDRALDSRQVMIKTLGPMLPSVPGVAGACVMGDGAVGIILELRELLRRPQITSAAIRPVDPLVARAKHALVVDDSLSARRTLSQLLADAGYEVATAIDGLDALSHIEARRPDVLLVDLEMPRMNGLELTSHLRSQAAWRDIPIVMITSRAAEKHRSQALRTGVTQYVTKPYLEHALVEQLYELVPP